MMTTFGAACTVVQSAAAKKRLWSLVGFIEVWLWELAERSKNLSARPLETEAAMPSRVDEDDRWSMKRGDGRQRTAPQVFVSVHSQKKTRARHNSVAAR